MLTYGPVASTCAITDSVALEPLFNMPSVHKPVAALYVPLEGVALTKL